MKKITPGVFVKDQRMKNISTELTLVMCCHLNFCGDHHPDSRETEYIQQSPNIRVALTLVASADSRPLGFPILPLKLPVKPLIPLPR